MLKIHNYISTDEVVERYCYRSRNQYFKVTKLRNYSTTAEATMTKFKLSSKAIYLGGNPEKMNFLAVQLLRYSTWTASPKRAKFLLFSFLFLFLFFLKIMGIVHHITGRWYRAIKLIFCTHIRDRRAFQGTLNGYIQSRGFGNRGYKP